MSVAALGAVALAGGASSGGADAPSGVGADLAAVCEIVGLVGQDDAQGAQLVFLDVAHEPLHELAQAAAEAGDRPVAASLLEAKSEIESSLDGPTSAAAEELLDATVAAVAATGRSDERRCP